MEIQALMIWQLFLQLVKLDNAQIKNINDKKIQNFDKALNSVLLNLAKRVVSRWRGIFKVCDG